VQQSLGFGWQLAQPRRRVADSLGDVAAQPVTAPMASILTCYLRAAAGVAMLRRITEHFPRGQMVFDGYSRLGVWLTQRYGPVQATGAQLDWAIGDPHGLEQAVPGLVFDSECWFALRLHPWERWSLSAFDGVPQALEHRGPVGGGALGLGLVAVVVLSECDVCAGGALGELVGQGVVILRFVGKS
jgi:hypothetical protein